MAIIKINVFLFEHVETTVNDDRIYIVLGELSL